MKLDSNFLHCKYAKHIHKLVQPSFFNFYGMAMPIRKKLLHSEEFDDSLHKLHELHAII